MTLGQKDLIPINFLKVEHFPNFFHEVVYKYNFFLGEQTQCKKTMIHMTPNHMLLDTLCSSVGIISTQLFI